MIYFNTTVSSKNVFDISSHTGIIPLCDLMMMIVPELITHLDGPDAVRGGDYVPRHDRILSAFNEMYNLPSFVWDTFNLSAKQFAEDSDTQPLYALLQAGFAGFTPAESRTVLEVLFTCVLHYTGRVQQGDEWLGVNLNTGHCLVIRCTQAWDPKSDLFSHVPKGSKRRRH